MDDALEIDIVGDFNPAFHSHLATSASLKHAAGKLNIAVDSRWVSTPSLLDPAAEDVLVDCDGIWASPGSPYQSMYGMLRAIEFARTRDWPFVGT